MYLDGNEVVLTWGEKHVYVVFRFEILWQRKFEIEYLLLLETFEHESNTCNKIDLL